MRTISEIDSDALWAIISSLEAEELLNFGMTCKRFYKAISSPNLWSRIIHNLQEEELSFPLAPGEAVEALPLDALRRVAVRACRLHRNLTSYAPKLYRHSIVKPPWKLFRTQAIPYHAEGCLKLFEGSWIIYRRSDKICIRHIDSIKSRSFEIPVISYVSWNLELSRVAKNIALLGIRHDVTDEWQLLEITFRSKNEEPKCRPIPLVASPYLSLLSYKWAIIREGGAEKFINVYTNQRATVDPNPVGERSYMVAGRYLFGVYSRPGGRIHVTATRLGKEGTKEDLISTVQSKLVVTLKDACFDFPPDEHSAETILRPSPARSHLTIWHRIPSQEEKGHHFLFIVDIPYSVLEEDERIEWGIWTFRSCYETTRGTRFLGQQGQSALTARYRDRHAYVTLYHRLRIPTNPGFGEIAPHGMPLPCPDELCSGHDAQSIRVCWDDGRGVAVLLFESSMLWVLHYA